MVYTLHTWKVLKCGAGEEWRRSVGPIVWGMKKHYLTVKKERNILHEIRKRKANWIGHILLRNCLLQRVIEGKINKNTTFFLFYLVLYISIYIYLYIYIYCVCVCVYFICVADLSKYNVELRLWNRGCATLKTSSNFTAFFFPYTAVERRPTGTAWRSSCQIL